MAEAISGKGTLAEPLRAAVVGCGSIAAAHVASLRAIPGVRIVGVCDRDPAAAARVSALAGGCPAWLELASLLAEARPHVLHVLTPPGTHRAVALEALAAGCHVLVEKPMALNVAEAEDMIAAAREAGLRLSVAHNFLFEPGIRRARALAGDGALGRVTAVEIFWRALRAPRLAGTPGWVSELPGGAFQEVAPHAVYLVDALLPDARVAAALAARTGGPGGEDELRVLFRSDTAVASLAVSLDAEPHVAVLRVHGTRRSVLVDLTTNVVVRLRKAGTGRPAKVLAAVDWSAQYLAGTAACSVKRAAGLLPDGRRTLVRRFYEALRAGAPLPVTGEEGRQTVALLDEIWRLIEPRPAAAVP